MVEHKEPNKPELLTRYVQECEERFVRWDELYKNGGSDPFGTDGANLNLVRNHIMWYKDKIAELCKEFACELSQVSIRETPPKVDNNYMANADSIIRDAKKAFRVMSRHPSYKKLLSIKSNYSEDELDKISYPAVVGYVSSLEKAIASFDLVAMRRYRNYATYIKAIDSCLMKSKELTPKYVQLSLFDVLTA